MTNLPWGYLVGVLLTLVAVGVALRPPPVNGSRPTPAFVLASASSEVPLLFLVLLSTSTALAVVSGDLATPGGWAAAALTVVATAGLVRLQVSTFAARPAVVAAVDAVLGTGGSAVPRLRPTERVRTGLAPLRLPTPDVHVVRDIVYGPDGKANTLDLYRRRRGVTDAPVLVHLHGGGFSSGAKSREARLLMQVLARRGWICVSANYRLAPAASFPDILTDAKRVVAWVRSEGPRHGAGPTVVLCGGSSGANLSMTAALTAGQPRLQPGFEDADTAVQALVCLYGYYGDASGGKAAWSPANHLTPSAPPTLVVHGARDPMVPSADARDIVSRLCATSSSPVAYAEIPGMLHAFDRFDAVRHGGVAEGVLYFLHRLGLLTPEVRPSPPSADSP